MPKGVPVNLVGQRFDRLVVLALAFTTPSGRVWECRCECGALCERITSDLRRQRLIGCPECASSTRGRASRKHGGVDSQLYNVWRGMRERCLRTAHISYPYYGARGVRVCAAWNNFATFQTWALKNGYEVGLSIDREDASGHYEPGNCRFLTLSENSKRRHATRAA